jgi:uncharacterized protein YnzC (UPF0291/DUF896 family)
MCCKTTEFVIRFAYLEKVVKNMDELTKRINELARKEKAEGLSAEEKAEQTKLREEFRERFRASFRAQLDNVRIVEPDGKITKPEPKIAKS